MGEAAAAPVARLRKVYHESMQAQLQKDLELGNINEVPRLDKIVLNMGLGDAIQNAKILDTAVVDLATITGQKPVVTRAKKAIANFKLREGMPIGAMVTLRGNRMFEFIDRLISSALPRVRDFKGVSDKGFDGRGNFSMGLNDQTIFPEIDIDKVDKVKGMTITVVTTARTDSEGLALLRALGMPFRKN
jgi:large subunit ribosomal protein L5